MLAESGFPVEVTSAAEQYLHQEALFDAMVTAPVATLRWQDVPVRDRHGGIDHRASGCPNRTAVARLAGGHRGRPVDRTLP